MRDDIVESLLLDMIEWIGRDPRPYSDVMAAWRTSCPQLPVWEEADERGFIHRHVGPNGASMVSVTGRGWSFHRAHRVNAL